MLVEMRNEGKMGMELVDYEFSELVVTKTEFVHLRGGRFI